MHTNWNNIKDGKRRRFKSYKTWFRPIVKLLGDFCKESNIHGLNHVAGKNRHWSERVFWLIIVAAAVWGAMEISLGQLQRFNESPTVVTLEKDFRSWNYSLPGVTTCEESRVDETKLPSVIKSLWNISKGEPSYEYFSGFVNTVANSGVFNLDGFKDYADDERLNVDLYQLALEVMPPSQVKTLWSVGGDIRWTPVMTEAGACYTINSLAISDIAIDSAALNESSEIPITCKNSKLSCYAIFEITKVTDFYFHSPYDIMDGSVTPSRISLTLRRQIELNVLETMAGKGIRDLRPHRRRCLYTDEPSAKGKKVYSTNSCRSSCRSRLAVSLCGCRPFHYGHEAGPICTPSGLACLAARASALAKFEGAACSCSQQCVDAVFQEISRDDRYWSQGPFGNQGALRFIMKAPMTRYTREIVFHFHDLVVSFGGAAGLFLGASFISLMEILYFVLDRTTRMFGYGKEKGDPMMKQSSKVVVSHEAARIKELSAILKSHSKTDEQLYWTRRNLFN